MIANLKLTVPDTVNVTITITGSIKDFKTMDSQLHENVNRSHWPLSEFAYRVRDAIAKAGYKPSTFIAWVRPKIESLAEPQKPTLLCQRWFTVPIFGKGAAIWVRMRPLTMSRHQPLSTKPKINDTKP